MVSHVFENTQGRAILGITQLRPVGRMGGATRPLTSGKALEVIMRIGRAIIIPAILAFGIAGSAVADFAVPAATGSVTLATSVQTGPDIYYMA
jgi:hypothetical protein